jgi:hypothetical protein
MTDPSPPAQSATSSTPPPAPLRAVLIGTATHVDQERSGLGSIPQVANNLVDLARALTAPSGLFQAGSIELIQDPYTVQDVQQVIGRQPRTGTLLCYFAGHGLTAEGRLCLALPGSIDRPPSQRGSSLALDVLLEQLVQPKQRQVILILDCCYAGLAFREQAAADVHLLTAVGKAHKAKYTGGRHTVFTGALLKVLREGIPDGTRFVDLDTLYRRIAPMIPQEQKDSALRPHQRSVNYTGRFRIGVNRAYEPVPTPHGLAARADFADEVGRAGDPAGAARLLTDIERDAFRTDQIEPGQLFGYRQDTASWTGQSGDAEGAVRLLTAMLAEPNSQVEREDWDVAVQSREYWRSQM